MPPPGSENTIAATPGGPLHLCHTHSMAGKLYLVATPIGNLEDITYRAVRVLREADVIACEDTRQTRKLLDRYEISKATVSYHEHNEAERAVELASRMAAGATVALVSDAGMPLVSDPGYRLVRAAIELGVPVEPVPGASAALAALAASGLSTDSFYFRSDAASVRPGIPAGAGGHRTGSAGGAGAGRFGRAGGAGGFRTSHGFVLFRRGPALPNGATGQG